MCQCRRRGFGPWFGRSPEGGLTTPSSILPEQSHGQKSLAGRNPWSHRELDMTEQLSTHIHSEEGTERRAPRLRLPKDTGARVTSEYPALFPIGNVGNWVQPPKGGSTEHPG